MSDHHRSVGLEDVIFRVELAIVATPARPKHRWEKVEIKSSKECPPFGRNLYRFRVKEIVWARRGVTPPKVGEVIEVDSASYGYDLTVHKKYYLENIRKITLHEVYEPSAGEGEAAKDSRRIVLLDRLDPGWSFACDQSAEPLSARARIEDLLSRETD